MLPTLFLTCATHNRTCCHTFCPLLIFSSKNFLLKNFQLKKLFAQKLLAPPPEGRTSEPPTLFLPPSLEMGASKSVPIALTHGVQRMTLKSQENKTPSNFSKYSPIFLGEYLEECFRRNIIRFREVFVNTSKRSWKIALRLSEVERMGAGRWAPCNPSLGAPPPQGECGESHKIRGSMRAHKAQWASGPRPRLSRQENNWGWSDTLGDHNATMDGHNGKSQWKSVERSQFSEDNSPHLVNFWSWAS